MDPNANYAKILELAEIIHAAADDGAEVPPEASRLAALVLDLQEWVEKGGALPEALAHPPPRGWTGP